MPKVTIEFEIPDEQGELDAALRGREAIAVLWDVDQRLRGLLKHGEPTEQQAELAREIRDMIPHELLEI
jgi:hypothetical protein